MPKRVVVLANKGWEADALCAVLVSVKARPAILSSAAVTWKYPAYPYPGKPTKTAIAPRITLASAELAAEVWSVEDVYGPGAVTIDKPPVIDGIVAFGPTPDLLIAFGTAAFPAETSFNGCATMGAFGYMFDTDPGGGFKDPSVGTLLGSTAPTGFFRALGNLPDFRAQTEVRFVSTPLNGAEPPRFFGAENYTALGVINVTNYDDYTWADVAGVAALQGAFPHSPIGSVETTHALIRSRTDAPFLWISGITDRVGYFNQENAPRDYAQNMAAAHNAGVVAAWTLGAIFAGAVPL